jgi:hypothetical protein
MTKIVELIIMPYIASVPKDKMILMRENMSSNELDDLIWNTVILPTNVEHMFSL